MQLCQACFSSLPPPSKLDSEPIYITPCCNSPICNSCITRNPRLKKYNPCLHCGAGVNASIAGGSGIVPSLDVGGVEEENVFVLEDEEDDAEGEGELPETQSMPTTKLNDAQQSEEDIDNTPSVPPPPLEQRYEIKRGDTLRGISLKFGIDPYHLCRINSLPPSAITTNPHLLHTRRTLLLSPPTPTTAEERDKKEWKRERAEKRLSFVTKEIDWRVSKTYVSLAEGDASGSGYVKEEKEQWEESKEKGRRGGSDVTGKGKLEERAIDIYMEDIEWEEEQLRMGLGPSIPKFPYASFGRKVVIDGAGVGSSRNLFSKLFVK